MINWINGVLWLIIRISVSKCVEYIRWSRSWYYTLNIIRMKKNIQPWCDCNNKDRYLMFVCVCVRAYANPYNRKIWWESICMPEIMHYKDNFLNFSNNFIMNIISYFAAFFYISKKNPISIFYGVNIFLFPIKLFPFCSSFQFLT